jgi:hypothetical protein
VDEKEGDMSDVEINVQMKIVTCSCGTINAVPKWLSVYT